MDPPPWVSFWQGQATFTAGFLEHNAAVFLERAEALVDVRRTDVVLDLGCGLGDVACRIAPRVRAYVGVDSSQAALAVCRQRVPASLAQFVRCELGRDPMPAAPEGEGYTLVLAHSVLQYLPSHEAVDRSIEALAVVAAPGALLLVGDLPGEGGIAIDVASQLWHGLLRGRLGDVASTLIRGTLGQYSDVRRRHGVLEFDVARLSSLARAFGEGVHQIGRGLSANATRRHLIVRRA